MKLEREHILSFFIKVMKKLYSYLYNMATKEIDETLPRKEVSNQYLVHDCNFSSVTGLDLITIALSLTYLTISQ